MAGTPPPLLGIFLLLNVFRSRKLIVIKINGHLGGQKMADYVLSVLPSKLRAATALCSKGISSVYINIEHKAKTQLALNTNCEKQRKKTGK